MIFKWEDDLYLTGVAEVNKQHKQLFKGVKIVSTNDYQT
jgi:hypothetical protein